MPSDIREYTDNYRFPIPNFDLPRWQDYYRQTLKSIDGLMFAMTGATGLRGVWDNATSYAVGDRIISNTTYLPYVCLVEHTSRASGDFEDDLDDHPSYWQETALVPEMRGNWVTATVYYIGQLVVKDNTVYICRDQHTSGTFATDLAASKWTEVIDIGDLLNDALPEAFTTTSASSIAIGTGTKAFTVAAGKSYVVGDYIHIQSQASAANYMHGRVTGYTGTALEIDVTVTGGSGTHADWDIRLSGPTGPQGPSGPGSGDVVAANNGTEFTASTFLTNMGLSANGKSLVTAANYAAMKALLDLEIGTDVQAYSSVLGTYASINPAANIQSILGAADYSAVRTLLALVPGTNVQAYSAQLAAIAALSPTNDYTLQYISGAWALRAPADVRTTLGLVIGTNVQAYSAVLAKFAAFSDPAADKLLYWRDSDDSIQPVTLGAGISFSSGTMSVSSGYPKNYLSGLTLSNNATDPTNDIDIAVGACRDATDTGDMILASALTKQLDAAWAVGTNAGGLDTGSIANGTYHVFLIKRTDTGVVDVLFSTSATSPTMPTNYTLARRIGSIVRASGAIRRFVQTGDIFLWDQPIQDLSATSFGSSAVLRTLSLPTGIKVEAIVYGHTYGVSDPIFILFTSPDAADNAPSGTSYSVFYYTTIAQTGGNFVRVRTNTSAQIRTRASTGGPSDAFYINTHGWRDLRGKEG